MKITDTNGSPILLFYNSNNGAARYVVIDGQGGVSQVASTSYEHGWTQIPAGTISSGMDGNVIFAYLFYNTNTGAAQFYQLNQPGSITQLSNTTFAKGSGIPKMFRGGCPPTFPLGEGIGIPGTGDSEGPIPASSPPPPLRETHARVPYPTN